MNFSRSALFHMKARVYLKYFVHDCLWKQFLASNSPQTPSNLICLTIFVTLRPLTPFQPKVRETDLQKKCYNLSYFITTFPIFSLRSKFCIESLFKFGLGQVFRKIKYIPAKIWLFLTIKAVNKDISQRKFCKESCSYHFETFWWLSKVSFHHKWNEKWLLIINSYIRVALRVAKQLKIYNLRKLGKTRRFSKLHRIIA